MKGLMVVFGEKDYVDFSNDIHNQIRKKWEEILDTEWELTWDGLWFYNVADHLFYLCLRCLATLLEKKSPEGSGHEWMNKSSND